MSTEGEDKLERVVAIRGAHRGVSTKLIRECEVIFRVVLIPEEVVERLQSLAWSHTIKRKVLGEARRRCAHSAKIEDIEAAVGEELTITARLPIQSVS